MSGRCRVSTPTTTTANEILQTAETLRWEVGANFHESLMEALYTDAARIADRAVTRPDKPPRFDLDRTIDRLVTSRIWGFPIMLLLLAVVFWLTISGANVPSSMLATLLLALAGLFLLLSADGLSLANAHLAGILPFLDDAFDKGHQIAIDVDQSVCKGGVAIIHIGHQAGHRHAAEQVSADEFQTGPDDRRGQDRRDVEPVDRGAAHADKHR